MALHEIFIRQWMNIERSSCKAQVISDQFAHKTVRPKMWIKHYKCCWYNHKYIILFCFSYTLQIILLKIQTRSLLEVWNPGGRCNLPLCLMFLKPSMIRLPKDDIYSWQKRKRTFLLPNFMAPEYFVLLWKIVMTLYGFNFRPSC